MQESWVQTKVHFHLCICTGVASLSLLDIRSGPTKCPHRILGFQMNSSNAASQNCKIILIFELLFGSKEQELYSNFLERSEFKDGSRKEWRNSSMG